MPSIINAAGGAAGGLVTAGDTSGALQIQSNGVPVIDVGTSLNTSLAGNLDVAGSLDVSGNIARNGVLIPLLTRGASTTASGTNVTFTGIPSTAVQVTVVLSGVSVAAGDQIVVQIGSGTFVTSGYGSVSVASAQTNAVLSTNSSTGFIVYSAGLGDFTTVVMQLYQVGNNNWTSAHFGQRSGWGLVGGNSGGVQLAGPLDRVRITTNSGGDSFDAGVINIFYQ